VQSQQRVAHAAADQERLETRLVQAVQHFQRTSGDRVAGYRMGRPRDDFRLRSYENLLIFRGILCLSIN
jgi:hypothetical protein